MLDEHRRRSSSTTITMMPRRCGDKALRRRRPAFPFRSTRLHGNAEQAGAAGEAEAKAASKIQPTGTAVMYIAMAATLRTCTIFTSPGRQGPDAITCYRAAAPVHSTCTHSCGRAHCLQRTPLNGSKHAGARARRPDPQPPTRQNASATLTGSHMPPPSATAAIPAERTSNIMIARHPLLIP